MQLDRIGETVSKYSHWLDEDKSHIDHYAYNKLSENACLSHWQRPGMTIDCLSYKDSDLNFRNPFPKYPATTLLLDGDPCTALLSDKESYYSKLTINYQGDKYPDGYMHNGSNSFKLPSYIFTKTIAIDPDEYMLNCYDYYFCGGFLSRFEDSGSSYLIRPLINNSLWITNLEDEKEGFETESRGDQIYNITVDNLNEINYLCVRQKKGVSVEQIAINEGSLTTIPVWKSTSEIPYIDIKLSPDCHVGTLRVNHVFEVYDVEKKKILVNHKIEEGSDNEYDLSQFNYVNTSEVVLMSPKVMELLDMRSKDRKSMKYDDDNGTLPCNFNCVMTLCTKDTNYAFVASKHDIVKIDLREMKTIKKWSHFLRNHPIILKYGYIGEEEYLCVSDGKDSMFLIMDAVEDYLPFKLPRIIKTYNAYYETVRPVYGYILEDRLDLTIAGMDFRVKDNDLTIFANNSAGDVYCYQSNKCAEYNIKNSNMHFGNWVDTLPELPKPKQDACVLVDIRGLKETLEVHEEAVRDLDTFSELMGIKDFTDTVNPSLYTLSEIWQKHKENLESSKQSEILYNDLEFNN